MFPIYILLDTSDGGLLVMEAANKWIWELNSPISPGNKAKIISINLEWNYRAKDAIYAIHRPSEETKAQEFVTFSGELDEAHHHAGPNGLVITLLAKRYGHIVLFLKEE